MDLANAGASQEVMSGEAQKSNKTKANKVFDPGGDEDLQVLKPWGQVSATEPS